METGVFYQRKSGSYGKARQPNKKRKKKILVNSKLIRIFAFLNIKEYK